jgi:dienelactone hydrolase
MKSESISFFNHNIRFTGTLYKPEGQPPFPAIVVVHPASEAKQSAPFYDHLKSGLPDQGIALLVFDRRGSGGSEGDFETADFEELADDVIAAVEYLASRDDIEPERIGLHGTSQGAWIAPIAAARKPGIACIVAVSACGVTPAEQMDYGVAFHLKADGYDQAVIDKVIELRRLVNEYLRGNISREQAATGLIPYESEPWFEKGYLYSSSELPTDITRSKWHYEMDYAPLPIWEQVTQPTLFLFAETDEWVPIAASIENYRVSTSHMQDVTLRQIPGTSHLMSISKNWDDFMISPEYLSVLVGWLTSRLKG